MCGRVLDNCPFPPGSVENGKCSLLLPSSSVSSAADAPKGKRRGDFYDSWDLEQRLLEKATALITRMKT